MRRFVGTRAIVVGVVSTAVIAAAGPASAHHSFAMFDFSKDLTLSGAIEAFNWANPHVHILLRSPDGKGLLQSWTIEGPAPDTLRSQGWSRTVLAAGDQVSVVVHPLKTGGLGGSLVRAYRADGSPVGAPGKPQSGPAS